MKIQKNGGGGGGRGRLGGVRVDVIEELKFLGKFTQKNRGRVGRGQVGGSGWWGGQGLCERRIEFFVKIKKNGGGVGGGGWSGRGEGSGWGGVRVDVNEELKFLGRFTKTNRGGGVGRGGGRMGVGLVGVLGGCERNVEGRG